MGSYNSINFTKLIVNGIPYNKAYMGSKILFENTNPFTLEITGETHAKMNISSGQGYTLYITTSHGTFIHQANGSSSETAIGYDATFNTYFEVGEKIHLKVVYNNLDNTKAGVIIRFTQPFKVYGDILTYSSDNYCRSMFNAGNSGTTRNQNVDISGLIFADTTDTRCYQEMFYRCNFVNTETVTLPATTLNTRCYQSMFAYTNISDITINASEFSTEDYVCYNMLNGTSTQAGILHLPDNNNYPSTDTSWLPTNWTIQTITTDYSQEYFTIKSLEDNNTITFTKYNQNGLRVMADKPIQYSKDLTTWNNISFVTDNSSQIVLNSGEKLYLKGTNSAYGELISSFYMSAANIQSSGNIDVMGNIMSLIYGDNFENNSTISSIRTFTNLFRNNNKLTNAKDLVLPTTSLTTGCYYQMFWGCTSLTTAPELPATTLVNSCYDSMFYGCTSLNYVKAMFTTTPSSSYTSNWVSGVSSTGTFVKNSSATWDVTGVNGVPSGWTVTTAS